jgi:tRNA threonylcarbamoyladenosine modification (KEOPS) complex Cgi121 subunit
MKVLLAKYGSIPEDALAVSLATVNSEEEIRLAQALAERAFKNKTNIAKKFKYEFLLWLTGKTDIKSALAAATPAAGDSCLVVVFKDQKIAGAKPAKLQKKAAPLELEKISLSRVKN